MEALWPLLLLLLGAGGGFLINDRRNKKKQVKASVDTARKNDKEGAINASLDYEAKVARARKAVEEAINSRPITGDAAADLADRIERARIRRRRRSRQRYGG